MTIWKEIAGELVDLSEIYRISRVYGDTEMERYRVFFKDGRDLEINQRDLDRNTLIEAIAK